MTLQFKETIKIIAPSEKPVLKAFEGRPYQQMPKLLAEGRTPLSMKGGMERRLEESDDAKTLQDNYFTSANLMVRNSNGDVVVATYENNEFAQKVVASLNEDSNLRKGSLIEYNGMNSDELYNAVKEGGEHVVISASKATNLNNDAYSEQRVRSNVWRNAFAEGDKDLDTKYGALVDKVTDRSFEKNRGLWLPNYEGGRLVWLGSVGDDDSFAGGLDDLDDYGGRLVGVGDGVASAGGADARDSLIVAPTLEQVLAIERNDDLSRNDRIRQFTELYKQ